MSTGYDVRDIRSVDPQALLQIQDLQLVSRLLVAGIQQGLHRSKRQGFSVEFDEYRPYAMGDDPRTLDWKLYARTDRYLVKKYRDETNRRCHILLDISGSMDWGSLPYTKARYAVVLAATLARYLWRQRDAVGLSLFDDAIRSAIPPSRRSGQLTTLLAMLDEPPGERSDLALPLSTAAFDRRRPELVVLISDFLAPLDNLAEAGRLARAAGAELVWLRVLDPAEVDWPYDGPVDLQDAETGRMLHVTMSAEQYRERFVRHSEALAAAAAESSAVMLETTTDQPISDVLLSWLAGQRRGGPVR